MATQPALPTDQAQQGQEQSGVAGPDQDLYDIFVSQGILMIAKLKLKVTKTPEVVARTMVMIVTKVVEGSKQKGIEIPLSVIFHGAKEILIALIQRSGLEFSEADIKTIVGNMVGMYLDEEIKSGRMTPEQVGALGKQAKLSQGAEPGKSLAGGPPPQPQTAGQPPGAGPGLLGGVK